MSAEQREHGDDPARAARAVLPLGGDHCVGTRVAGASPRPAASSVGCGDAGRLAASRGRAGLGRARPGHDDRRRRRAVRRRSRRRRAVPVPAGRRGTRSHARRRRGLGASGRARRRSGRNRAVRDRVTTCVGRGVTGARRGTRRRAGVCAMRRRLAEPRTVSVARDGGVRGRRLRLRSPALGHRPSRRRGSTALGRARRCGSWRTPAPAPATRPAQRPRPWATAARRREAASRTAARRSDVEPPDAPDDVAGAVGAGAATGVGATGGVCVAAAGTAAVGSGEVAVALGVRGRRGAERQHRRRVDVPVLVGRPADAEVDVRVGHPGLVARTDRPDAVALDDRRALGHSDGAQVGERDRPAVRRLDRDAPAVARNDAGERDDPRRGRADHRPERPGDVDPAVVAGRLGSSGSNEYGCSTGPSAGHVHAPAGATTASATRRASRIRRMSNHLICVVQRPGHGRAGCLPRFRRPARALPPKRRLEDVSGLPVRRGNVCSPRYGGRWRVSMLRAQLSQSCHKDPR